MRNKKPVRHNCFFKPGKRIPGMAQIHPEKSFRREYIINEIEALTNAGQTVSRSGKFLII